MGRQGERGAEKHQSVWVSNMQLRHGPLTRGFRDDAPTHEPRRPVPGGFLYFSHLPSEGLCEIGVAHSFIDGEIETQGS